jgi:membrane fusion protein (multidrug efflux system)
MSKSRVGRFVCLGLLAAVVSVHIGCGRGSDSDDGKDDEVAVPVEVAAVILGDISSYFTGTATLEAEKETEVVAKVGGVVSRIYVEEGDYIKRGQALAKLDDEKLSVQMEQATANLKKLETEYQRSVELYDERLISDQDFQRAGFEYESQKATYDLQRLELEYTSIRSPISGVVSERMIKVGNMLGINQPVFRVTDLDPLLAVLHVPERLVGELKVGQISKLSVDALADETFAGQVERISPVVDPSTGTIKVTVTVYDASRRLKPGMFARINIVNDVHTSTVLAPREAIIEEDKETSVFVVRDSTVFKQDIETGYVNSIYIEVTSGLMVGDTVVTLGKGSLKDSVKVEFVNADEDPADTDLAETADGEDEAQADDDAPADDSKTDVSRDDDS